MSEARTWEYLFRLEWRNVVYCGLRRSRQTQITRPAHHSRPDRESSQSVNQSVCLFSKRAVFSALDFMGSGSGAGQG
jgi:hypothetical protein